MTTHQIFPSLPSLYCCNTKQTKTNTVCTWQVKLLWMESKKNGFVYQEFHLSYFYPMPNLLLQSSRMIVWFNIYQKKNWKICKNYLFSTSLSPKYLLPGNYKQNHQSRRKTNECALQVIFFSWRQFYILKQQGPCKYIYLPETVLKLT